MEQCLEKLKKKKKFFVLAFLVSAILMIFAHMVYLCCGDNLLNFFSTIFDMNVKELNFITIASMGLWKILIVQFTLVPAIVLCLMKKSVEKKIEKDK
ncbi:MAG: hypothetical protein R3Y28_05800 [Candidatus Gastranaerophilales bacterium]